MSGLLGTLFCVGKTGAAGRLEARRFARVLLLLCVTYLAGCETVPPIDMVDNGPAPEYRIAPGDQIRVLVHRQENLSGEFNVDSRGRIALPFISGVMAAGLTIPGLEKVIGQRLVDKGYTNPQVSIDLLRSHPVCVLGEVNKPGCYQYIAGMRAATAIALAGGYTYRARKEVVKILRVDGEQGTANHDILVYPGDLIEVDERGF